MKVSLRPVESSDRDFLLTVYASTRAQEMAMVPWTADQKAAFVASQFAAQTAFYSATYPEAQHSIICRDGEPAGRLFLARLPDDFRIADITVLPQFRSAGIGSFVLHGILNEASQAVKPVSIYVESFNPSRHLFERLGFVKASEDGFNLLLKWHPAK